MSRWNSLSLLWSGGWTQNLLFFWFEEDKIITTGWQWTGHFSSRLQARARRRVLHSGDSRGSPQLRLASGPSLAWSYFFCNFHNCHKLVLLLVWIVMMQNRRLCSHRCVMALRHRVKKKKSARVPHENNTELNKVRMCNNKHYQTKSAFTNIN